MRVLRRTSGFSTDRRFAAYTGCEKTSSRGESVTSAAEAVDENKPDIAAVNRCATRDQAQHRVFSRKLLQRCLRGTLYTGAAICQSARVRRCPVPSGHTDKPPEQNRLHS